MCASPSAVTRFGCGEIGRSGNSSTPSSSSLTNALLMRSSFAPIYSSDYIWEVHGHMETLKAVSDAPHRQRFRAELFRQEKVHIYWASVSAALPSCRQS